MGKLILLDGNAIMHRAYHAMPPLTTRSGEPINAVYGFVSMLLKIINDIKPTHIIAAFDRKEKTFRKKEYEKYQAHRPEMDEELSSQITRAQQMAKAFAIPVMTKAGFEADDIIGTITKKAKNKNSVKKVIIVTGDRDIMQLVDDQSGVVIYLPVKGMNAEIVDEAGVIKKLNVRADQIIDYKAMAGDSSDNYPGIYGVGPKTASSLLQKYGDLKTIYKHLDKLSESTRKKFIEQKENALLSQRLAKIMTNVDVDFDKKAASNWKLDSEKAMNLFEEFGFRTLTTRVKNLSRKIEEEKQGNLF